MKKENKAMSAANKKIKKLHVLVEEKEDARSKLAVTAKKLAVKAKDLAVTAKETVAENKEVVAENKEMAAEKKELVAENKAVVAENKETTAENKESVAENKEVVAEKKEMAAENKELVAENKEVVVENKEIVAENKEVVAENKEVVAENKEMATEKKEMVAENKEVVAENKEVVAESKAVATENKEVVAENKELQSKDLAKDEFVSVASHQLRTPLTAINGFTAMLIKEDVGPVNDKQREYLGEIKDATDRMIDMITGLLNVSRVDLGVFVVEPQPTNVELLAESIRKELDNNFKSKSLVVKTSFEKDIPLLNVDPQITRMVFENLLSNALKYTPAGGTINLGIKKSGSTVLVSVADTGLGIPESAQPKIFEKMFRADNAQVKDPSGTGLGLYIIKETIEKTGGKIWFESKENQGSTFYVSIPLEGMKKREGSKRLE